MIVFHELENLALMNYGVACVMHHVVMKVANYQPNVEQLWVERSTDEIVEKLDYFVPDDTWEPGYKRWDDQMFSREWKLKIFDY